MNGKHKRSAVHRAALIAERIAVGVLVAFGSIGAAAGLYEAVKRLI